MKKLKTHLKSQGLKNLQVKLTPKVKQSLKSKTLEKKGKYRASHLCKGNNYYKKVTKKKLKSQ